MHFFHVDTLTDSHINPELLHTTVAEGFQIPGGTGIIAYGQLAFDILTLLHQCIFYLIMGMIFRKIGSIRKINSSVIGIKV